MNGRIKELRKVNYFDLLNISEIEEVAQALEVVEYEEGTYLGESLRDSFLLVSGECVVEFNGEVVFKLIDTGHFGEECLLCDHVPKARVRASSKVAVCFKLSRDVFRKITKKHMKTREQGLTQTTTLDLRLNISLGRRELMEAVEALELITFKEEDYVVRQDEIVTKFFTVDAGKCVAEYDGEVVTTYCDGNSFG